MSTNTVKWIDDRVPFAGTGCPNPGSLTWGTIRKPVAGDSGYIDYQADYSHETSVEDCAAMAGELLVSTNALVKESKQGQNWDSRTAARYATGRVVRKTMTGSETGELTKVYWTFDNTPEDAEFGATCHVYWNCAGTTEDLTSVSGVADLEDQGARTSCTIPRYTEHCIPNKVTGAAPPLCTPLAMRDFTGDSCRSWYDTLPDDQGPITKATVSQGICDKYPYLDECLCLNRNLDPMYQRLSNGTGATVSDVCWWLGCKMTGYDRRITPDMERARNTCTADMCQNIIQVIDSKDIDLLAANQATDCKRQDTGGSSGVVVPKDATPATAVPLTLDGGKQFLSDALGGMDSGMILMIALLGGGALFLLVAGLLAYKFLVLDSKGNKGKTEEVTVTKKSKAK